MKNKKMLDVRVCVCVRGVSSLDRTGDLCKRSLHKLKVLSNYWSNTFVFRSLHKLIMGMNVLIILDF